MLYDDDHYDDCVPEEGHCEGKLIRRLAVRQNGQSLRTLLVFSHVCDEQTGPWLEKMMLLIADQR
jgi:hypothetical protein